MRRKMPAGLIGVACLVAMVWTSPANAQHRHPGPYGGPMYGHVPFRAYYGAYYYSPWFYSGFWLYPSYPYGYPYYGYPYGPAGASVRVEVQPKTAEVFVDGHLAGIVDQFDGFFQSLPVEPGGHDIAVYLEGYRSIVQRLYLSPGSSYKIKGVMEKLASGEPSPPRPMPASDARDVEPRDQPPPDVTAPAGPPPQGRPREAYPPMESDARFGQVAIRVQPADAEVTIDGEPWRGPQGADRLVVHLAAGTHRVEIRKEGFDPFVTAVEIRRGDVTVLNVSLGKL